MSYARESTKIKFSATKNQFSGLIKSEMVGFFQKKLLVPTQWHRYHRVFSPQNKNEIFLLYKMDMHKYKHHKYMYCTRIKSLTFWQRIERDKLN